MLLLPCHGRYRRVQIPYTRPMHRCLWLRQLAFQAGAERIETATVCQIVCRKGRLGSRTFSFALGDSVYGSYEIRACTASRSCQEINTRYLSNGYRAGLIWTMMQLVWQAASQAVEAGAKPAWSSSVGYSLVARHRTVNAGSSEHNRVATPIMDE